MQAESGSCRCTQECGLGLELAFDKLGRWGPGTTKAWDGRSRGAAGAVRRVARRRPGEPPRGRRRGRALHPRRRRQGLEPDAPRATTPARGLPPATGRLPRPSTDLGRRRIRPQRAGEGARSFLRDASFISTLHAGLHDRLFAADRSPATGTGSASRPGTVRPISIRLTIAAGLSPFRCSCDTSPSLSRDRPTPCCCCRPTGPRVRGRSSCTTSFPSLTRAHPTRA